MSNPELKNINVVDTNETKCSCSVGGNPLKKDSKDHPCHKTGGGTHSDNGNHGDSVSQNGHVHSTGCPDPTHYEDGVYICCCYGSGSGGQLIS